MGTVPISVIYGHKYPLSPIPAQKAAPSTPPSMRASSVWPSGLAREPPQLVQRRKYDSNVNGLDTDTAQKKTRGCLSYISSLRNRQTTTTLSTVTREPATTTSSFNATSYCFRKPNLISSSRAKTVDPNYSSYSSYHSSSYKSLARATTVSPTSAYSGYYGRSNVARAQDYRPKTTWYRPSRFTMPSSITSSFSRFRSSFQSFKTRYF